MGDLRHGRAHRLDVAALRRRVERARGDEQARAGAPEILVVGPDHRQSAGADPGLGPGPAREPGDELRRVGDEDMAILTDRGDRGRAAVQLAVDPLQGGAHLLVMSLALVDQVRGRAGLRGGGGDDGGDRGGGQQDVLQRFELPSRGWMSIASGRCPTSSCFARAAKEKRPGKGGAGAFPRNPVRRYATGRTRKLA